MSKKTKKTIKKLVIALLVLFFIPTIVNAVVGLLGPENNINACWNNASDVSSNTGNYNSDTDDERKKISSTGRYERR